MVFLINPQLPTPPVRPEPVLRPISISLPDASPYPVNSGTKPPYISAKFVYAVDAQSMATIYLKNPDQKMRPASTTKIMTALVAMESLKSDTVVTSSKITEAIGKTIKLKSGEQIGFDDMLYALLLESGNDVAFALAENYAGGYTKMVEDMNLKAKKLGMENTLFKNVSGLDQHQHETTAHDMAILASEAIRIPLFAKIVSTKQKEIKTLDGNISHQLKNTNELLEVVEGVKGIKTGLTELAGENLITLVDRNGHQVIIGLFGSQDRFGETKKVIEWIFSSHDWKSDIVNR
jgi:D-alanyl-D-alanine carboxypeptidase (penicillin-binding protein 5/6)